MVREITDMMNQSSPAPGRRTGDSTHTVSSTERLNERSFHAFESKLSGNAWNRSLLNDLAFCCSVRRNSSSKETASE